MPELPLLVNIAVALAYALIGGSIARWVGLPTIVGYLLAGVALGPFTPGFNGDEHAIHQLAEFGIMLLMFGVGLHFSFKDLWEVRDIAIPGAAIQTVLSSALAYAVLRAFGYTPTAALRFAKVGAESRHLAALAGVPVTSLRFAEVPELT